MKERSNKWRLKKYPQFSSYLERESIIAAKNALRPYFFVRKRAVEPRFDTKSEWEIFSGLAERLGINELSYKRIEDIWNFQLTGTGVSIEDFSESGLVYLSKEPYYRPREDLAFKTPSGKIEVVSGRLEEMNISSLAPYEPPPAQDKGCFRLTFGKCAQHTQGHTLNNPALYELVPENELWINTSAARNLGINDGEKVNVSRNGCSEQIRAKVTDFIHPDAVFVLHGFGHRLPVESRAYKKGLADNCLMQGGLEKWDPAGGAVALQENFVTVSRAQPA